MRWDDYDLPDFNAGSVRSQPFSFRLAQPLTGAPVFDSRSSVSHLLPVAWQASIDMTEQQAREFARFMRDIGPARTFTKSMLHETGHRDLELIFTSKPQPIKINFNHWQCSFVVYSAQSPFNA